MSPDLPLLLPSFLRRGALLGGDDGHLWLGLGPRWSETRAPGQVAFGAFDFFGDAKKPWLICDPLVRVERSALRAALAEQPTQPWRPELRQAAARDVFVRTVERVLDGIAAGRWQKVVPTAADLYMDPPGVEQRAAMLMRLLDGPAALIPYGFWLDDEGLLGATPELLFELRGPRLSTMALAGTAQPGEDPAALLHDPKQRHEHQLVIDMLRRQLSPLGELRVEPTGLLKLPGLAHLHTPLRCHLREPLDAEALIRLLHPSPALGGAPRAAALEFLHQLDTNPPRRRFGAPFCVVAVGGQARCVVAIRGVQWRGPEVQVRAGCGVVAGSDPEREWRELRAKLAATLGVFCD